MANSKANACAWNSLLALREHLLLADHVHYCSGLHFDFCLVLVTPPQTEFRNRYLISVCYVTLDFALALLPSRLLPLVNLGSSSFLLYLQGVRGLTAFDTGLTLLPFAIWFFITATLAGAFSSRFGSKWIVTIGMFLEVRSRSCSSVLLSRRILLASYSSPSSFSMVLVSVLPSHNSRAWSLVTFPPNTPYGAGLGANNTLRQVGAAIGVAILGAVLASSISSTAAAQLSKNTVIPGVIKPAIQKTFDAGDATNGDGSTTTVVSGTSATVGRAPAGRLPSPSVIGKEIKGIYDLATTDGNAQCDTGRLVLCVPGCAEFSAHSWSPS